MDDSISRQAAIEVADAVWRATGGKNVVKVWDQIKDLPSVQPEQKWIPMSERLPEMDERVLVTSGGYDYNVWDCMLNRGDDYFWEDEEGFYHNKYEVVAWMPLPEPYREEGEANESD